MNTVEHRRPRTTSALRASRWSLGLALGVASSAIMLSACGPREVQVSFSKDVMPILQASCHECHLSGGKGATESGLLLDSYENVMKGTKFGPVVKPGNGLASPFNQVLEGRVDKSIRMPHGGTQIFESKVKTLRAWVDQGAKNN